jgi:polysaccharide biosynthesis/export protein
LTYARAYELSGVLNCWRGESMFRNVDNSVSGLFIHSSAAKIVRLTNSIREAGSFPAADRGNKKWPYHSMALLLLILPPVAFTQQSYSASQPGNKPPVVGAGNGAKEKEAVVPADAKYVIGPQDTLDITVWKEPDLTRTVAVRPDGKISLPLLDDVQAGGLTPAQLGSQITEKLKKYLTEPRVTVVVTAIASQRFYVLGEVTRAGAYPLLAGMTVLQALSSAGGFTEFANSKNIYVLRMENGKQVKHPFNYKDVISGKNPDLNVELKAGDTIVVP